METSAESLERIDYPNPYELELESVDPSPAALFDSGQHWAYFERLRREDPVHFVDSEEFGPYWSITKFNDIVKVDSQNTVFSSEPSIAIGDSAIDFEPPMFIAMDNPKHDGQRKAVSPAVAPVQLDALEQLIRGRVGKVLDSLPVGETFNWVDKVSIELTTQMLATLFDFPFEERHKLTYWSDIAVTSPTVGISSANREERQILEQERQAVLMECLEYFTGLWNTRIKEPQKNDFISLLAHSPATAHMEPLEYLGNLMLLIVGGNDTTRSSMSGGVLALNQFPAEFNKLKSNPDLIPNMVSEIIRWQTPLAHMRRNALEDAVVNGKTIRKGDKVVMWYVSGNRDEEVIENANDFIIDRKRARHHVS
ncbi:MAG: cytochrome P450, partial [Pseudomonadales bacterium]